MRITWIVGGLAGLAPTAALACGGLFCNATQPVNQSAERILFAPQGTKMHMHVRISYAGPPTEFGWLVPVPPDVETELSSEQLFQALDQQTGPLFTLQQQLDERCADARFGPPQAGNVADNDGGGGGPAPAPEVQVISREAIGPYDRVILDADNVQALRAWLDENGFAIPEQVDATLTPYLEMGNVFVALKLLPGTDSGDIQPLHLSFTSETAAIPILPTRVAAEPDMGVIVHYLAGDRAIPKNYAHVHINEAAIDWPNFGQNYADVVSAAADETAGGKAWVTDYAGPSDLIPGLIPVMPAEAVAAVREAAVLQDVVNVLNLQDADIQRLLAAYFTIPEGTTPAQFFSCFGCFGEIDLTQAVDGQALAAELEAEINTPREALAELFADHDTLTRLYTTMSPAEMDQDPIFATNPDLAPVDRQRTAIWHIVCDDDGARNESLSYVETPSGLRFTLDENGQVPDAIARQAGETVRGAGVPAARLIEQMFEQGQPQVISDRTQALRARYGDAEKDGGCDCDASAGGSPTGLSLALLGLLGLGVVRRRR